MSQLPSDVEDPFLQIQVVDPEANPVAIGRRTEDAEKWNKTGLLPGINQRRHFHYQNWLNQSDYEQVWLLDSRDIIFQANPFDTFPDVPLMFSIDKSHTNADGLKQNIAQCLGDGAGSSIYQANSRTSA